MRRTERSPRAWFSFATRGPALYLMAEAQAVALDGEHPVAELDGAGVFGVHGADEPRPVAQHYCEGDLALPAPAFRDGFQDAADQLRVAVVGMGPGTLFSGPVTAFWSLRGRRCGFGQQR